MSGKSDLRSTLAEDSAISNSRTHANGSIPCRLALPRTLIKIAAVSAPRSLPKNIQFIRPLTRRGVPHGDHDAPISSGTLNPKIKVSRVARHPLFGRLCVQAI